MGIRDTKLGAPICPAPPEEAEISGNFFMAPLAELNARSVEGGLALYAPIRLCQAAGRSLCQD